MGSYLAVGYSDGMIRLWNLKNNSSEITLSGHKSPVSCLSFDAKGTRLVSGSADTEIIMWDIVGECGLYRLKGHKGMITGCVFMRNKNVLVTCSKDTFVKFWDLDTQHCFLTLVGHRSEIWQIRLIKNESVLVTGSCDSELRFYTIAETKESTSALSCELQGSMMRQSKGRVVSLIVDATETFIACHGIDSTLDIFQVATEEEIKKRLKKKKKKELARLEKLPEAEQPGEMDPKALVAETSDEIKHVQSFKLKEKLRSCDLVYDGKSQIKVFVMYINNLCGCYKVALDELPIKCNLWSLLQHTGHRSDVRALAFSSDASLVVSGSGESVKVWNRSTLKCIRTMESEYCLCCLVVPGDRHVIVGTKSGKLQLFDINAGSLLESIDAHEGSVWALSLSPDKNGFISGSADQELKFWDFELVQDENFSASCKRLSMTHTQTLKMTEEVLAVKYSPSGKLLTVSLLDSTVKVFMADSLKFFLSLYGHKFPVLCMGISVDSTLLVTGSADKNIKIWGLEFGDCHKSIFAHDDTITAVEFVGKTHYFFSASKDKTLKYWDADKFQNIMTLQGHHGEIWGMCVSGGGEYVVTSSHDKSIRVWQRTEELLVLDEEREQEREEADEMSMVERGEKPIPGEANEEVSHAGKQTMETVKSSELDESLLVLPFAYVVDLLELINEWLLKGWCIERVTRCMTFLLKIHHNQITTSPVLLKTMESLREHTSRSVQLVRDQVGFNLAGLRFLQQQLELRNVSFFEEATESFKKKVKTKKIVAFAS